MNLDSLPWIKIEDKDAIKYVKQYLPSNPVIIEAGVCDAEDTIRFKHTWPDCTIYGFEPVPSLYEKSKANTASFKNVNISKCALGSSCGERKYWESRAMPGASSFFVDNLKAVVAPEDIKDAFEKDGKTYNDFPTIVDCITIDKFCEDNKVNRVDYIWLDTEGNELDILRGATKTLAGVRVLSLELNFQEFRAGIPLFEEVHEYITNIGFEIKHMWQARPNWQANGIFVRKT